MPSTATTSIGKATSSAPLCNFLAACNNPEYRQEAMQLLQRREWDVLRETLEGEDDGPSCEQHLALWAMLCVMNNKKEPTTTTITAPQPLGAEVDNPTQCKKSSGKEKKGATWSACLLFNAKTTGNSQTVKCAHDTASKHHYCLLCRSTSHGLVEWNLAQSPPATCACPVWNTMMTEFHQVCLKLEVAPSKHLSRLLEPLLDSVPSGDVRARKTPPSPPSSAVAVDTENVIIALRREVAMSKYEQQLCEQELSQQKAYYERERAEFFNKQQIQERKLHQLSCVEDELSSANTQFEETVAQLKSERDKHEQNFSSVSKQLSSVAEAHQRFELMSYIKQVVTESMIRHGTCKQGPMLQMEFNDHLDRTPVFRKFMKALLQRFSPTTPTGAPLDALTFLRKAKLRFGYHGTHSYDAVASIMEHGFDPNKRGANGQVHGPGEYFDLDLSIAPQYARQSSTPGLWSNQPSGGMIGCLIFDDPRRVVEKSHQGTRILVVDNPTETTQPPGGGSSRHDNSNGVSTTLCLPVFVIGHSARSIIANLSARAVLNGSCLSTDAILSSNGVAATNPAPAIDPLMYPPIHDIEFLANDGTWTSMTPSITDFLRNNYNYGTLISTFDADGYPYEVDLTVGMMQQTNLDTGRVRPVRIVYAPTV